MVWSESSATLSRLKDANADCSVGDTADEAVEDTAEESEAATTKTVCQTDEAAEDVEERKSPECNCICNCF